MPSQQIGIWLNYETHKWFRIEEHEQDLRQNPEKFGVDLKDLEYFIPIKQRDECLMFILKKYPLCRIRQYSIYTSCEFISDIGIGNILWDIYSCISTERLCGEFSGLSITNIGTDSVYLNWLDFKKKLQEDQFIIKEEKGSISTIFPKQAKTFNWIPEKKLKFENLFEEITKRYLKKDK